jgi:nucleoid DNA-binding protein
MNEKLNLQDIATLLAERSGITKREAELFLKECFETVQEALLTDQSVKIKNLGSFKLSVVSDRESIDVVTGERVLIPAHYKAGFTPDSNLAQTVNEPFALFETVEVEADKKIPDTEVEIIEPEEEDSDDIQEEPEPIIRIEIKENNNNEENKIMTEKHTDQTEKYIPEIEIEAAPQREHSYTIKEIQTDEEEQDYSQPKKVKSYKKTRNLRKRGCSSSLIYILILLTIFGLFIYFYLMDKAESDATLITYDQEYTSGNITTFRLDRERDSLDNIIKRQAIDSLSKKDPAKQVQTGKNLTSSSTRTIQAGERLTLISLDAYGNKVFWVYLYEENKNIISNPNNVAAGLTIQIPPAEKYGINKDDPASVRKAQALVAKYERIWE